MYKQINQNKTNGGRCNEGRLHYPHAKAHYIDLHFINLFKLTQQRRKLLHKPFGVECVSLRLMKQVCFVHYINFLAAFVPKQQQQVSSAKRSDKDINCIMRKRESFYWQSEQRSRHMGQHMYRVSVIWMSTRSLFHHRGARTVNSCGFYLCLTQHPNSFVIRVAG